jgi:hypothetical protein
MAVEWAVPALTLSVPGIFVMAAVGAQSFVGIMWLPLVRRKLGAFGLPRRRSLRMQDSGWIVGPPILQQQ